jgi:hypothetical protein
MGGTEVIQTALRATEQLLVWHLSDLCDTDLFVRPAAGANHLAWQLGHLIVTERFHLLQQFPETAMPKLPDGFAEAHAPATAGRSGPDGFWPLRDYRSQFSAMRAASVGVVGTLSEADLSRPAAGAVAGFAPTVAAVLLLVSNHTLLHCGQVTVVRRALGKPVLF